MNNLKPVSTVEEIEDPRKYIPSSIALKDSNGKVFHVTSDLLQVAYLQFKSIFPAATKLRRWKKKKIDPNTKETILQQRAKIHFLYNPTPGLDIALAEYVNDHNGCKTLMRAYDTVRAFSFRQIAN